MTDWRRDLALLNEIGRREPDLERVRELAKDKAMLEREGDVGVPPLVWAIINNQSEVVKILIDAGANVNVRTREGDTPLLWAVYQNREDIVKTLLESGAQPGVKNSHGKTELDCAEERYAEPIIFMLKDFERRKIEAEKKAHADALQRIEDAGMKGIPRRLLMGLPRLRIRPRP